MQSKHEESEGSIITISDIPGQLDGMFSEYPNSAIKEFLPKMHLKRLIVSWDEIRSS